MAVGGPSILVFSTLFPSPREPGAGVFIRERMFRVGRLLPVTVVSPRPWFPLQGLARRWRPHFRPPAPRLEVQQGFEVHRPRFPSIPGLLKSLDGVLMAIGSLPTLRRLRDRGAVDVIDAHFAYPDGYAAVLLGRWLGVPVTVTLRGTEVPLAAEPGRRRRVLAAVERADRVFSVSSSLRDHLASLGADPARIRVVGNGVDVDRFRPLPRAEARRALRIPDDAPVLVSVGGLVERKGFHRVIDCLPRLREQMPGLRLLIVGGPSPEGDMSQALRSQVARLGLEGCVTFVGHMPPDSLRLPLCAADVFVLATANEGWANVFLEAMACGLPVVTTRVGGNAEVVSDPALGILVPLGDGERLTAALAEALTRDWDRARIRAHAETNTWESRVQVLVEEFRAVWGGERARREAPRGEAVRGAHPPSGGGGVAPGAEPPGPVAQRVRRTGSGAAR